MASRKFNNIVAVLVWYQPTTHDAELLSCYGEDVSRLIIVDNSEKDNRSLLANYSFVDYLPLGSNKGIATALNQGFQKAMTYGADWVLTMDQDSQWKHGGLTQFVQEAEQYADFDQVGIFSPLHETGKVIRAHKIAQQFEPRQMVMTSGNLVRVSAWEQAKGYREDFFIDCVDDEFDCHLLQLGWQIIRINTTRLSHPLGEGTQRLLRSKHTYTTHPAWRYFYIARNLRAMAQLYPHRSHYYKRRLRRELKRLFIYDWTPDKWKKIATFVKGYRKNLVV